MSYPTVWDRFEDAARRFSSRLAASDLSRDITYSKLADLAGRIAGAATAAVAGRPGPVAILLASDARLPAAMLGVLAAARPYLPLNPEHSIERNRSILIHSGATAVISAGEFTRQARAVLPAGLPVIDLDDVGDWSGTEPHRPRPEDLAQIIYTSGSTGTPKGVAHDHRGLGYAVELRIGSMQMCSEDRVAFPYAPGTAAGALSMLSSLLSGASLHLLRPQELMGAGLAREMRGRRITVYHSVPTLFRRIVATLGPGERLGNLRIVRLGGERIDWSDVDAFRRACEPGARLVIGVSCTETGPYAEWVVDETLRPTSSRLPVGRPVPGYRVTIVQEDGRPAADGEAGEFVVASPCIALGYWTEPELTKRAFDGDPADPSSRTFRTGDRGRRRPDGLFEFLGRRDDQIKLRGHRIELGDVEAALRRCAAIRDAAVVVRRNGAGVPLSLIGFAEPVPGTRGLLPRHVMAMASRLLPREMMPSAVVLLNHLPRLPSLKPDRVKLAELHALRPPARSGERTDPFVKEVMAVFKDVLGIDGARPEDSFRSLGGDSLQGVEVALELERRLGVPVPPRRIEEGGTIRDLAEWIGSHTKRKPPVTSRQTPPDPAALAADISAAFRDGRALDLAAHHTSAWQDAINILLARGDLKEAEYGVRRIHPAYPELPYPRNLCEVFDHLPAADAQPAFKDDAEKEVQVVRNGNADAALLLFCGNMDRLGLPLPLIHRWLGRLPAHLVYLRDFRRLFFMAGFSSLGGDREVAFCRLRTIISSLGARRLVCYGNSAGVFAALHYGLHLNAEAVLGVSGPTNLSAEFNAHLNSRRSAARLRAEVRLPCLAMSQAYAAPKRRPRVWLVYGDSHWDDRLQAEDMGGLPDVVLQPLADFSGHNTIPESIARGLFDQQLQFLVDSLQRADKASPPAAGGEVLAQHPVTHDQGERDHAIHAGLLPGQHRE
jgi:amino acid adenylation domain-containing protein